MAIFDGEIRDAHTVKTLNEFKTPLSELDFSEKSTCWALKNHHILTSVHENLLRASFKFLIKV